MTVLTMDVSLASSVDEVWAVVGDFGGLDQWHPMVPNCRMDADGVSRIITAPGVRVVEVLDPEASTEHCQVYTVEKSPMPIRDYRATLSITATEGGCVLTYSSQFMPNRVPESVAVGMLRGFFVAGFAALKKRFGAL